MPFDPRFPPVTPVQNLDPWDGGQVLARGRPVGQLTTRGATLPGLGGALSPGAIPGTPVPGGVASSAVGGAVTWVALAHQYAGLINIVAPVGLVSAKIIDQPPSYRNFLLLRNPDAAAKLYIQFGSDATTNSSLCLLPGVMVLFDMVVPQDDLYCLSDTAGKVLSLSYSTIQLPERPLV